MLPRQKRKTMKSISFGFGIWCVLCLSDLEYSTLKVCVCTFRTIKCIPLPCAVLYRLFRLLPHAGHRLSLVAEVAVQLQLQLQVPLPPRRKRDCRASNSPSAMFSLFCGAGSRPGRCVSISARPIVRPWPIRYLISYAGLGDRDRVSTVASRPSDREVDVSGGATTSADMGRHVSDVRIFSSQHLRALIQGGSAGGDPARR